MGNGLDMEGVLAGLAIFVLSRNLLALQGQAHTL